MFPILSDWPQTLYIDVFWPQELDESLQIVWNPLKISIFDDFRLAIFSWFLFFKFWPNILYIGIVWPQEFHGDLRFVPNPPKISIFHDFHFSAFYGKTGKRQKWAKISSPDKIVWWKWPQRRIGQFGINIQTSRTPKKVKN